MCIAFHLRGLAWPTRPTRPIRLVRSPSARLARSASFALPLVLAALASGSALGQDAQVVTPPADAPVDMPPPPPGELPAPPQQNAEPAPAPAPEALPDGQWVYTSQYGWVFMPYAQNYTYVPDVGYPYEFVYYPTFGWRWISAPWIFGVGPRPYWGTRGYVHFAWHAHPWFAHRAYVGRAGHPVMRAGPHGGGHFGHHR